MTARQWVVGPGAAGRDVHIDGPVTIKVISGTFERVNEAIFYPTELADELNVGRFEGRTELIRQIDRFIDERKRGYLVVVGAAGVGKSALAARLVWQRKCAFHFTGQGGGSRIPEQARKSLAAQLIGAWQLSEEFTPHDTFPKSAEKAAWLGDVLRAAAGARDKIHPDKRPPIVLVIDALDEAGPDAPGMDTGVPLGLPAPRRLPDGVFIVATSRFGAPLGDLDRSDRLILDIRSATNRQDMASYLHRLLDGGPDTDDDLVDVLGQHHMSTEGFVDSLLRACDGGWMYLTYVLDDIREKRLSPAEVSGLPGGLRAHYMQQVTRWENNDEALWRGVRRPTLALLAALRRRATAAELADWAKADAEDVANWLDQDLRAFLKVTKPRPMPHTYRIRHQSLRDLFVPQPGPAPDTDVDDCLENEDTTHDDRSSERLHRALIDAHRRLTTYFVPPGDPGERTWSGIDEYARCNLPEHAAACGRLDDLVADVGFLLTCDPAGILCYRSSLRTPAGVAAVNAYEAALHEPTAHPDDPPGWWIHVWAKKTGAGALADSAIRHVQRRRMWTVQTAIWAGATHRTIAGHTGPVAALTTITLPDGSPHGHVLLASGADDTTIRLWDPATGEPVGDPLRGHTGPVAALTTITLPDGSPHGHVLLASGADDTTIRLWDPATGQPVGDRDPLRGHTGPVAALTTITLPDGSPHGHVLLASGADDTTIRLWDPATGQPVGDPLRGHTDWVRTVTTVALADRGTMLVSSGEDATMLLWDPTTCLVLDEPLTKNQVGAPVSALASFTLANRRPRLASGGGESIRLWDPSSGRPVGDPITGQTTRALAATKLPGGRVLLASGGADRLLRVWDVTAGGPGDPGVGPGAAVRAVVGVTMSDGRTLLCSGGIEKALRLWDPVTGLPIGEPLAGHTATVRALTVIELVDGSRLLVSADDDGSVRCWDLNTLGPADDPLGGPGSPIMFGHNRRAVWGLASLVTPDGRRLLATASADRTVRLWRAVDGAPVGQPLKGHRKAVLAVAAVRLSDGRTLLASGSDDATIRLWDPVSGDAVGDPLTGHTNRVRAVASVSTPDGALVASGSADGTLRLWNPVTRRQYGDPLTGHEGPVLTVSEVPLPDGRSLLASGGTDATVRLWDPTTGAAVGEPLTGHTGWVRAVAALTFPDKPLLLATGGEDRALLLWSQTGGVYVSRADARRIFIVHASEDKPTVRKLHGDLLAAGHDPWLDEKDIFPGQDWDYEIQEAIESADCVVVCLSEVAVSKIGYVQREIRKVTSLADDHPDGDIYLIPVRLDRCETPRRLARWQYVDYFEPSGLQRLLLSLKAVRRK